MHKEIDRIFDSIKYMVVFNVFNGNYYNYLIERRTILEDLIHYYKTEGKYLEVNHKLNKSEKNELRLIHNINKQTTLESTLKLLESRIEEVEKSKKDINKFPPA